MLSEWLGRPVRQQQSAALDSVVHAGCCLIGLQKKLLAGSSRLWEAASNHPYPATQHGRWPAMAAGGYLEDQHGSVLDRCLCRAVLHSTDAAIALPHPVYHNACVLLLSAVFVSAHAAVQGCQNHDLD